MHGYYRNLQIDWRVVVNVSGECIYIIVLLYKTFPLFFVTVEADRQVSCAVRFDTSWRFPGRV